MEDITTYLRCRTCGGFVEKSEVYNGQFCSRECSIMRKRCLNCGRYFVIGESEHDDFCSEECFEGYNSAPVDIDLPHFEGDEL